jgi:hypothetical protein
LARPFVKNGVKDSRFSRQSRIKHGRMNGTGQGHYSFHLFDSAAVRYFGKAQDLN